MKQIAHRQLLLLLVILVTAYSNSALDWANWAKNQKCSPAKIWYPKTVEEVRAIILEAAKYRLPVRVVGSGHSWSDLVCTTGYLINTDSFNKILSIDKERCIVQVEAGIKLKDLFQQLASAGLALSNQGYISEQSIAGATATATHGSGHTGCLSDFVIAVQLIDSQGNSHDISEKNNPEWLSAARVHLGALGFIYSMTLQCEPLFILNHRQFLMKWEDFIDSYKELHNNNDYCMTMGPVLQDTTLVYTWNRSNKRVTNNFLTKLLERLLMSNAFNTLGSRISRSLPRVTDTMLHFAFRNLAQNDHREYSFKTLSPLLDPISVSQYIEEEHAIPIEYFAKAVKEVRELYAAYEKRGHSFVAVIACRFSPAYYTSYLAQNYGRETAYITINGVNVAADESFYRDLDQLMLQYAGRPHWGKLNYLNRESVLKLWGESAQKFNNVRKQLDPGNMFANEFIKRCFN
jgi:L-gulono-1,4-lactone dehydrogenase